MSVNDAKWNVFTSFLASAITSFFVSDFLQLPWRYFLEFFPFCIRCRFRIWHVHCFWLRNKLVYKIVVGSVKINFFPCSRTIMILCRDPSMRFLVDSSASTMHAHFVLVASGLRQVSLYFPPLILQCVAAGIGTYVFHCSFELLIRWINEVNTAQSSSVVKLRFIDSTFLFLFSVRCFWHLFPSLQRQVIRPWCRLFLCQPLTGPCIHIWRVFLPIQSTSMIGLGVLRYSDVRLYNVQASHPRSYLLLWLRRCIVVWLGLILLSARTVWLSVQRDDSICSSLKWTRNRFLLHHHTRMSLESRGVEEDPSDSPRRFPCSSPRSG